MMTMARLSAVCVLCVSAFVSLAFFFFNDTATTEIYTLSLHDALPIYQAKQDHRDEHRGDAGVRDQQRDRAAREEHREDRKSTRLNSSHTVISYAVFCLKKKKERQATAAITMQYNLVEMHFTMATWFTV